MRRTPLESELIVVVDGERAKRPSTSAGYVPMADQGRVERIRQWHEQAYAHGKAEGRAEQTFSYLGTSLIVPPEVMPITAVSRLLGEAVLAEVRDGDPPFRWFAPRDRFEVAMTDENYAAMTRFFREARHYLTPGGRLLIFFGTSGDLDYLQQLAAEESFTSEVLAQRDLEKDGWRVDHYTFRMAQTS